MVKDKKKNWNGVVVVLYSMAAVCFYISSAVNFFSDRTVIAITMMTIGSLDLLIAALWLNKMHKNVSENNTKPTDDMHTVKSEVSDIKE